MKRYPWEVPDPLPTRIREWVAKHLICPVIGHDYVTKMDGTKLCRRH